MLPRRKVPDTRIYLSRGHWYLSVYPLQMDGRTYPLDPKKTEEFYNLRKWLRTMRRH